MSKLFQRFEIRSNKLQPFLCFSFAEFRYKPIAYIKLLFAAITFRARRNYVIRTIPASAFKGDKVILVKGTRIIPETRRHFAISTNTVKITQGAIPIRTTKSSVYVLSSRARASLFLFFLFWMIFPVASVYLASSVWMTGLPYFRLLIYFVFILYVLFVSILAFAYAAPTTNATKTIFIRAEFGSFFPCMATRTIPWGKWLINHGCSPFAVSPERLWQTAVIPLFGSDPSHTKIITLWCYCV